MQSVDFLMQVWEKQCREGEFVCLSAKGSSWKDTILPFDSGLRAATEKWLAANKARNCYFCPLPFIKPRRDKAAVARSHYLWSDIDAADYHRCPPSVLWESSPGRHQGLWLL